MNLEFTTKTRRPRRKAGADSALRGLRAFVVNEFAARLGAILARRGFPGLAWFVAGVMALSLSPALHGAVGQTFVEAQKHWAFQPLRRPEVPEVQARDRVRTPVDAFVLAGLEAKGLTLAPPADKRTILRRVYYDLIGLPPTLEEVRAYERDPSQEALAVVVDRLLADPRYGERWGRHWLDVARYADTKDLVLLYGRDALRPFAYTYRDYVIRALNEDIPFSEFIRDQLAADLVRPEVPKWRLAAMGFLTLGRLFDNNPHDQIDDQIDTVARGLLGLTVACARCHDHKYDAVKMEDYYGLYGVFASTERPAVMPLIQDPAEVTQGAEFEARLSRAVAALDAQVEDQYEKLTETLRARLGDYLVRAATTPPDLSETTQFALSLTPDDFRPSLMQRTRRFLERRAKVGDRVFGLWAELMALPEESFSAGALGVMQRAGEAVAKPATAETVNRKVVAWLQRSTLATKADVARAYADLFRDHYRAGKEQVCDDASHLPTRDEAELTEILRGTDGPVWFALRDTPNHMSRPDKDTWGGLVLNLDKLAAHASNAPPARAMVVEDLPEPYESRVFLRGSPSRPGGPAPRGFLRVLNGGEPHLFGKGSGRLELAEAITGPGNPLTPRVLVNRFWMHHLGEPLAASTADFGARSEAPAQLALMDWLASEFVRSGWRLKDLHRWIVLSSVYQQSSVPDEHTSAVDPDNRWLGHYPRRRVDLESMRDTMLYVAGRLDPAMGGRPVDIATDPLARQRTIYGLVDRQNLPGLFRSFDFAVPDQCVERRPRTTVPQQALFAMNAPFVLEQARALVAAMRQSAGEDSAARVGWLIERVFGRAADEGEKSRGARFLESVEAEAKADASASPELGAWEQLAQVLLVSNEAVFID